LGTAGVHDSARLGLNREESEDKGEKKRNKALEVNVISKRQDSML
jgi:hypothetical protein